MSDKIKLLVFAAGVFIATYAVSFVVELPLYLLIILSVFFTTFSFILNIRLEKALHAENKNQFTYTFLGLTGIKMLASLVLLACTLALSKQNKFNMAICIMSYYMLYTIFEVITWRGKLK
ncbi:MAG TPA: hypothetical protein VNY73_03590 [Bacteroidia bacterium]|jgi:hypothetical protein|nr:hypothetical protein [Bacteroidia bacterium]